jgi:hypothetical protein
MTNEKIKETLQALREKEAWKTISEDMKLTPELIDKFIHRLNWEALSENRTMRWTTEIVSKYKKEINWTEFSDHLFDVEEKLEYAEHLEIVRKFPDLIDWEKISGEYLPSKSEYLKEFSERWNWTEIAENTNINWTDELFAEYEDKLLPVLADIMFENLADDKSRAFSYRRRRCGLMEQLIKKDVSELQVEILREMFRKDLNLNDELVKDLLQSTI